MAVRDMVVRIVVLGLFVTFLFVASVPIAAAQESEKTAAEAEVDAPAAPSVPETPLTRLDESRAALTQGLAENLLRQFAAIDSGYGTIRAVENVQMSVGRAVKACTAANPDMETTMTERFEAWKDALRPVIKKARGKIDKMILLQGFAQPSQVRAHLRLFDAAIIYRNEGIVETPVSSKAECEKLLSSMDQTQADIIRLMTESLALDKQIQVKGL
ncbi:MAG: hypothetical protein WC043_05860 [Pseudobdellovibrionaceae bacterium]